MISALKGRRPWPLDERGLHMNWAPLVGAYTACIRYMYNVHVSTVGLYSMAQDFVKKNLLDPIIVS